MKGNNQVIKVRGAMKERWMKSLYINYKNSYLSYFLMYNFYYLSWALFSALISVYLMEKGFRASQVSFVVSASFFASMVAQPVIGTWNDKYDMKKVDTILFLIACVGGIIFMLSDSLVMITISYSLVLVIINGVNPVMEKLATSSPYSYGKIRIWGTIGYALGSQMAGIIYDTISPAAVFGMLGDLALLAFFRIGSGNDKPLFMRGDSR